MAETTNLSKFIINSLTKEQYLAALASDLINPDELYLIPEADESFNVLEETFTATAGQTLFTLTTGSYKVGTKRLEVYINGTRQPYSFVTQTSSTSFTLVEGLEAGDSVIARFYEMVSTSFEDYVHASSHLTGGSDEIPVVTQSANGLMDSEDKTKLDNIRLEANTTLYVATTGNDITGDGSIGAPYATIMKAINSTPKNLNGFNPTINIATGTYGETVTIKGFSSGYVTLMFGGNITVNGIEVIKSTVFVPVLSAMTLITGYLHVYLDASWETYGAVAITVNGGGAYLGSGNYGIYCTLKSQIHSSGTITVNNTTGSAISCQGGSSTYLGTITAGSGNTGYGLNITTGANLAYNSSVISSNSGNIISNGGTLNRSTGGDSQSVGFDTNNPTKASASAISSPLRGQSTDITLVLADAGSLIAMNTPNPTTITIPLNSSVAFPVGTEIEILRLGTGSITIAAVGGVTISSPETARTIAAQYNSVCLKQIDPDWWILQGALG